MSRTEAAQVLAVLQAAYQHVTIEPINADVWYGTALQTCDAELGRRVVGRLIAEDKFFPTPARFLEMKRALTPSQRAPELPSGERRASPEFVKNIVAEMRETLANAKGPLAKDLRRASVVEHTPAAEPPEDFF